MIYEILCKLWRKITFTNLKLLMICTDDVDTTIFNPFFLNGLTLINKEPQKSKSSSSIQRCFIFVYRLVVFSFGFVHENRVEAIVQTIPMLSQE